MIYRDRSGVNFVFSEYEVRSVDRRAVTHHFPLSSVTSVLASTGAAPLPAPPGASRQPVRLLSYQGHRVIAARCLSPGQSNGRVKGEEFKAPFNRPRLKRCRRANAGESSINSRQDRI